MVVKPNKVKQKRTTQSKYDKYRDYFVVEGLSLKDISEHFGLKYTQLRQRSMQMKWGDLREENITKTKQKEVQKEKIQNQIEMENEAKKALTRVEYLKQKDDKRLSHYEFYLTIIHAEIKKMVIATQEKGEMFNAKVMEMYVKCVKELTMLERLVDNQPTNIEKSTIYLSPDPEFSAIEENERALLLKDKEIKRLKDELNKQKEYGNTNTGGDRDKSKHSPQNNAKKV